MASIEIPIFINSSPENVNYISQDKSLVQITLRNPIRVPQNAYNIKLALNSASIWWSVANIEENVNDKLYFTVSGTAYTIDLHQGLYSVYDLNTAIQHGLTNLGLDINLIKLSPNNSSGKVIVKLQPNVDIDFTQTDTFRQLIGFDSVHIPETGETDQSTSIYGNNVAIFSDVSSFLVHTDLLSGAGIAYNNTSAEVLSRVLITEKPGMLLNYEPQHLLWLGCNIAGREIRQVRVWITNQKNEHITLEEAYDVLMTLKYDIK